MLTLVLLSALSESVAASERQGPKSMDGLRKAVYHGVSMRRFSSIETNDNLGIQAFHYLLSVQGHGPGETVRLTSKGLAL